ncbi:MAG TPA: hypothetical protein VGK94_12630 [Candidatus Polarisedimenticolia bacterium]|jgi:K+-sensing histidine kinase KdpD
MVIPLVRRPERLDRIVGECLDEAATDLAARRVAVRRQIDPEIPDYPIDRALFKEAIAIMMGEAIGVVNPARGLRVTVKAGRNALMIAVKAPGPGVDDARREALFTGDPDPGTLARARAIIASHEGVIWANGISGLGITYYVTLPVRRA